MVKFELVSEFTPKGDQPEAIKQLIAGIEQKKKFQTLLGATGTGKTFTMANIIAHMNVPTLIMSPNKLLAAQLYQEFKTFFPHNSVHYYISYFDYYQPEAYNPASGVYIEKDSDVNDEIIKYRLAATHALMTRQDVIVVASVSCIYGIGNPIEWAGKSFVLEPRLKIDRKVLLKKLLAIQYERNNIDFHRGTVRVHGDVLDIFPGYLDTYYRVNFFGDEIESIFEMNPVTNEKIAPVPNLKVFPTREFVTIQDTMDRVLNDIQIEMNERVGWFKSQGKWAEAQRLEERTKYDMEMLRETGYCKGIENYSRFIDNRKTGDAPACLMDYFPKEYLLIMDESHIGVPQIHGMIGGDVSRKKNLVEYGFRLPAAYDNRPQRFEEWEKKISFAIFTSATPGEYEVKQSGGVVVDQIIRPTGLIDPQVTVRPVEHQIDELLTEIRKEIAKSHRVLVTTLTKRMAESISEYYTDTGIKIKYLHSDIESIERMELLRGLRLGDFDVLIGINLLREGLDLPEVGLVAILDGDKEGFLRDTRSLIQTIGRASRNAEGRVIIFADKITQSIEQALKETNRRRTKQIEYNTANGITPQTIKKKIQDSMAEVKEEESDDTFEKVLKRTISKADKDVKEDIIKLIEDAMFEASKNLEFEKAAYLRDRIKEIREGKLDPNKVLNDEVKISAGTPKSPSKSTKSKYKQEDGDDQQNSVPRKYDDIHLLGTVKYGQNPPSKEDYRPSLRKKSTRRTTT